MQVSLQAPTGSLSIDAEGDVGLGVEPELIEPNADLHIASENATASLFMDNSTTSDWRVISGASGLWFSSVDGSNSNAVKFGNDAPSNSLVVEESSGQIGIGTAVPSATLHVRKQNQTAKIRVEEASGITRSRELLQLVNNGACRLALENTDQSTRWDFRNSGNGDFAINLFGTTGTEFRISESGRVSAGPGGFNAMDLQPNGNLIIAGTLVQSSDRNAKENFVAIDHDEILDRVSSLPISAWNYKSDDESVRHIGPVAQDFHAAFDVGLNDRTISMADAFGVALTAIKALSGKTNEAQESVQSVKQRTQILEESMEEENRKLKKRLASMEQRVQRLEAALETVLKGKHIEATSHHAAD